MLNVRRSNNRPARGAGPSQVPEWYASSSAGVEMTRTFVALIDPVQALLRQCTREVPLRAPGPRAAVEYDLDPGRLPEAYFSLAAFHALQGLALSENRLARWRVHADAKDAIAEAAGYFDATRLDRRCGHDLRLKPCGHGARMVAAELLGFGSGALRATGCAPGHAAEFQRYGRLSSRLENVYARITALRWTDLTRAGAVEKEIYCSTNVIYGDALGELEQLWERRAETDLLDRVARHLQSLRDWPRTAAAPRAPLNFPSVAKLHLRSQPLWRQPPLSGRSLLRRIEFILEHTIIDDSPATRFELQHRGGHGFTRQPRRSGYDGWLPDPGAALN